MIFFTKFGGTSDGLITRTVVWETQTHIADKRRKGGRQVKTKLCTFCHKVITVELWDNSEPKTRNLVT